MASRRLLRRVQRLVAFARAPLPPARSGPGGKREWTLARIWELFPRLFERRTNWGDQLSGGEQQMLSIGRALMTNPDLLMLDEATEGLAPKIRDEIWLKLWGNVCFNPISALTHATLDVICSDPATRALSKAMMLEAQQIAETFGVKFRVDVERRIEGARKVGAHKTSMLQDLERGRPMEIDPLVTVVQEMGRMTKIVTPAIDAVLGLVIQRAKVAGLY